jgi:ribosome-binding factor A
VRLPAGCSTFCLSDDQTVVSKLPIAVMSLRLERVREMLKREIGEVIRRELPVDEVGLINVNDLDVAPNLKNATVYVGILGGKAQKEKGMEMLEKSRVRIQGLVAKDVILKYTPRLRFVLDDSIERGNRVLKIIEELEPPDSSS